MTVFVNPGSGPVENGDEVQSLNTLTAFTADLRQRGIAIIGLTRREDLDSDGRFGYELQMDGYTRTIEMPGIPVEQVRFLNEPDQNIWHYPRLYVDGSSWVWCFALDMCAPNDGDDVDG